MLQKGRSEKLFVLLGVVAWVVGDAAVVVETELSWLDGGRLSKESYSLEEKLGSCLDTWRCEVGSKDSEKFHS